MNTFGQWLLAHPITFALCTLALSCVVSIFSGDIRRFLTIPPQRLNLWVLKARISSAEDKLQKLQKLHENSYELILEVASYLAGYALATITLFMGLSVNRGYPRPLLMPQIIFLVVITLATYLTTSFLTIVSDLRNYSESSERLVKKIDHLKQRLQNKI